MGRQNTSAFPAILLILLFLMALWWIWSGLYDHDEIEHLHAAWLVAQGQRPFVDFFEHHHPMLWYLLAPLTGIITTPHLLVVVVRIMNLALLAVLVGSPFRSLSRWLVPAGDWRWAAILLLSSSLFSWGSIEVRPDPPMCLLCFVALWWWVRYLRDGLRWQAAASGLMFGLAVVMLQKALVTLGLTIIASVGLLLLHRHERDCVHRIGSGMVAMISAALVPTGTFVVIFGTSGMWKEFYFWNYTFNKTYFSLAPMVVPSVKFLLNLDRIVKDCPLLCVAGGVGIGLFVRDLAISWKRWDARCDAAAIMLFVFGGHLVFLLQNSFCFKQDLLMLFLLLGAFSGYTLSWMMRKNAGKTFVMIVATGAVAVLGITYGSAETNGWQGKYHEVILRWTEKEDPIAVSPNVHPIFRKDAFFFWFCHPPVVWVYHTYCQTHPCLRNREAEDDERWERSPPKMMFVLQDLPFDIPHHAQEHLALYEKTPGEGLLRRKQ